MEEIVRKGPSTGLIIGIIVAVVIIIIIVALLWWMFSSKTGAVIIPVQQPVAVQPVAAPIVASSRRVGQQPSRREGTSYTRVLGQQR